ncbi:hypothetical protein MY5147_009421 [Beauveria neobassiana]
MAATTFQRLPLPDPQDWVAGERLFPSNVIAGYNAKYNEYNKETWAAYVLKHGEGFEACGSTIAYSAINSGTPKDRMWFGYVFRGGSTTPQDYERAENVQDTIVYTKK